MKMVDERPAATSSSAEQPQAGGKLYLTEEQWEARWKECNSGEGSSAGGCRTSHTGHHDCHASKRSKVSQEETGRPAAIPLAIHLAIRGSPIGASTAANTAIGPRIAASLAGIGPILPKRKTMAQRCSWWRSAHRRSRALCSAVPKQRRRTLLHQNRAPLLCSKSIWRNLAPNSTSTLMATAMLIGGTLIPAQRTT